MIIITIYCIYQRCRYRFTVSNQIKLDELERQLRKRLNIPDYFEFQRIDTTLSSNHPLDGESFKFQERYNDYNDLLHMEVIYGPPSVFGL